MTVLRAPFPWFGGKSRVAHVVWERFGDVANYVEPFAGSLAVLLARPHAPQTETANDRDGYLVNFWRAVQADPEAVWGWADQPVLEADLHARHVWLLAQTEFRERMLTDPDFYDAKIAGWWVWGLSLWIGDGWCRTNERTNERTNTTHSQPAETQRGPRHPHRKIPALDFKSERGIRRGSFQNSRHGAEFAQSVSQSVSQSYQKSAVPYRTHGDPRARSGVSLTTWPIGCAASGSPVAIGAAW